MRRPPKILWTLFALISGFAAACDKPQVACPCATNNSVVITVPDLPDTQLTASGSACPDAPVCGAPPDGGGCVHYLLQLTQAGGCHLTATTPDGWQETADLTVQLAPSGGCCGGGITISPSGPITFTYAPAGQDGGGG